MSSSSSLLEGTAQAPVAAFAEADAEVDDASTASKAGATVTELRAADVLLGRGAPTAMYPGNVRFREVVRERKVEYMGTRRYQAKNKIARQVYTAVRSSRGRFLTKRMPPPGAEESVSGKSRVWVVAERSVAMDKIKQALRDHPKAARSRLPTVEAGQGAAPEVVQCGMHSTSPWMPSPAAAVATSMLPSLDMATPTTPLATFLQEQMRRRSLQRLSLLGARSPGQHVGFASILDAGALVPGLCHYPLEQSNVGLLASGSNAMGSGGSASLITLLQAAAAPMSASNRQQLQERYLAEQYQLLQQQAAALPNQQLYRALLLRRLREGNQGVSDREARLPGLLGNAGPPSAHHPLFGTGHYNEQSGAGLL